MLSEDPARCAACSAALAHDQRYCISCGAPREPLGGWQPETVPQARHPQAQPAPARLPAPRSTALAAMVVLGIGVFIGGAFGPQPSDTLADDSARTVIVVAQQPTTPALDTPSPDSSGGSSALGDIASGADTGGNPAAGAAASGGATPQTAASPDSGTTTTDTTTGGGGGGGTTGGSKPVFTLPSVKHVFTIALSSRGFDQLFGSRATSSYLAHDLASRGTLLSNYYGVAHGGLAGRIALIGGQAPTPEIGAGCPTFADVSPGRLDAHGQAQGNGCVFPRPVKTIADQLTAKGLPWRAYLQGMDAPGRPATCRHPASGAPDDTAADRPDDHYLTASNPFVYFHSIADIDDCRANDVPLARLTADLASADLAPSYSFIAPDRCHDGRDGPCADGTPGGLAATEAFLRQWVPAILGSPAYKQGGLLVITADEAPASGPGADSHGCCSLGASGGGRVGALLLSPYVAAGKTVRTPYDHYSLLRTVEDLFSLDRLGHAGDAAVKPFGADVFRSSVN